MILTNVTTPNNPKSVLQVTPPNCDSLKTAKLSFPAAVAAAAHDDVDGDDSDGEDVSDEDDEGDEEVEADLLGWNGTLSISWESVASGKKNILFILVLVVVKKRVLALVLFLEPGLIMSCQVSTDEHRNGTV